MRIFGPIVLQEYFMRKTLPKFKSFFPNYEQWTQDLDVFLDTNPTTSGINSQRPHYDPNHARPRIVIPNLMEIYQLMGEQGLDAQIDIFQHEIGHHLHFLKLIQKLPDGRFRDIPEMWQNWAKETGHKLDLTPQTKRGYWFIPSYEAFAWDVWRMVTNRTIYPYYIKLAGLRMATITSKDYKILKDSDGLDRAYIPIRKAGEALDGGVHWINQEVVLITR